MRRLYCFLMFAFLSFFGTITVSGKSVKAADIVASYQQSDIFGEIVSQISIRSNGVVELNYKYGLRKADIYYCVKGNDCDNG